MRHPFENIRRGHLSRWFLPLFGLSVLLFVVLTLVGEPLITQEAPFGIVSFELARNEARAASILQSWDQAAQLRAAFSLGLDYVFIPVYSTTLALACIWASHFRRERHRVPAWLAAIGIPGLALAWAQWFAAAFDAIENYALSKMLFDGVASPWPQVASLFATIKFILVAAGIIYPLAALAGFLAAGARTRLP